MCAVQVGDKRLFAVKAYCQLNPFPNSRSGSSCAEPLPWLFLVANLTLKEAGSLPTLPLAPNISGLLLHQILAATGKRAGITGLMAAAFFSRCAHISTFFDHLQLNAALRANINLAFSHFMTIRHFTNLLSASRPLFIYIIGWLSGARKSKGICPRPSAKRL